MERDDGKGRQSRVNHGQDYGWSGLGIVDVFC